jgi:hypothetical protein
MRVSFLVIAVLLTASWTLFAQAKAADKPDDLTPRRVAEQVLDAVRDDTHKQRVSIIWPPDEDEEVPAQCEVYVIRGHLAYTCTRIAWKEGVVAAFAILKTAPADEQALAALQRIAGDPSTPIPPKASWYDRFARHQAFSYLQTTGPEAKRWNAARIREQLAKPDEDGRMVQVLFQALDGLKAPATDAEKRTVRRRVLAGKLNRGVLDAIEYLIKLKDADSAGKMMQVLDELLSSCAEDRITQPDAAVKYPWTYKGEIQNLRKQAQALTKP